MVQLRIGYNHAALQSFFLICSLIVRKAIHVGLIIP
jgi:hypothetical protein